MSDRESRPCCINCRKPMRAMNDAKKITRRRRRTYARFKCNSCNVSTPARSTHYGRLSAHPFCVGCRRVMRRANGNKLPGGKYSGAWLCCQCRAYTLQRATRYRPQPSQRAERILKVVACIALPDYLNYDERQETRAAILCDLLSGKLKQNRLDAKAVRRYVRLSRVSNFDELRLDAPLPDGKRSFGESLEG